MTVGPLLAAVDLFWLSFIEADTDYWKVLLPTLFIAMGMGTSFVPLTLTAVSGVRRDEAGLASPLLNTGQQIGGSLGLAILVPSPRAQPAPSWRICSAPAARPPRAVRRGQRVASPAPCSTRR
jgi:hypothetical protein